jgi:gluconolactonase
VWFEGRLLFVEYPTGGVKSWDGKQVTFFWDNAACGASGLTEYRHHLLVACYDTNSIVELDANGRQVGVFSRDNQGHAFSGPNDFAADGQGGVYISASGVYDITAPISGTLLHLSADGQALVTLADTIHFPNGLTVDASGQHVLVAEMLAGRILSFPINADGSLGPRQVWARLQDWIAPTVGADAYNGPDGFKLGPDGNYYVAQNGSGRVLVITPNRQLARTITVPTPFVTNIGFGPKGADTIYITGAFDQWNAPYPGVIYQWTQP